MKYTGNKWKTDSCGRCGEVHSGYSGKLNSLGEEYVVCGNTNKSIAINPHSTLANTFAFETNWIKESESFSITS